MSYIPNATARVLPFLKLQGLFCRGRISYLKWKFRPTRAMTPRFSKWAVKTVFGVAQAAPVTIVQFAESE
jgi:hypothetical protein